MPVNRKPKAWNLKPQMTAAPELWEGAEFVAANWEKVGDSFDLSKSGAVSGGGTLLEMATWIDSPIGASIDFSGQQDSLVVDRVEYAFNSDRVFGNTPTTIFCYVRKTTSNLLSGIISCGSPLSSEGRFALVVDERTSGFIQLVTHNGTFTSYAFEGVSLAMDRDSTILLTWDGVNRIELFINGVSQGFSEGLFTPSSFPSTSLPLTLGASKQSGNRDNFWGFGGQIHLAGLSSRQFSAEDARVFAKDPFAMLRPAGF